MQINIKKIHTFTGHRDCIYALSGGQEANIFYSAGGEGFVVKWDLATLTDGQLIAKVDASVYALHYYRPLDILIIGQNNEGIHLVDPKKKKVVGSLRLTKSSIFDISSYGSEIFVCTGDGVLFVVDPERLIIKEQIKLSEKSLRSIAINVQQNLIAAGASDNDIYIVDLMSKKLVKKLSQHKKSVFAVKYSAAADRLISVSRDAYLNFWKVQEDHALETSIPAHMYAANHIDFRPDQKFFATGSMDKTIKIWDYERKKLVKVIDKERHDGHLSSVNKVFWSDFYDYLVSASDDRTISVWDLKLDY